MTELFALGIIIALVLWVYAITKGTDAQMQARGEDTPAPEWARALFILFVVGGLSLFLIPAILMGLAASTP